MSIGKYLTNAGVLGSVFSAFGAAKQAQQMPRDWRRFLIWGVWAAGLALAIASAAKQQQDEEYAESLHLSAREEKAAAKARRKRRTSA
ncbi:hypothetical protein ACSHWG_10395 [Leucobacter sp. Z1108]|uniref:hypothetical protein n=1 Tax=Leucobacter sp. Z1108 TaxID=3439066 RepID=UPI003F362093